MTTKVAGDYVETLSPKGYVNNREITNLPGHFLVSGSVNTRIINGEKVASGLRYELKGAAKDVNKPIVTSYDWKTSTNVYRNIRGYNSGGELEVWFEEAWERIKSGYVSVNFEWAEWWDSSEQIDVLLGVRGDDKIYMWSGGIAEVASVTASTITKKGYYEPVAAKLAFNDNGAGVADTITDVDGQFLVYGFAAGDSITIQGSTSNDGDYTIASVIAGTITLVLEDSLVTESGGITTPSVRWTGNGTWAEARFLVSRTSRAVLINGVEYAYTGGESTGTLTGVTPDPSSAVAAGDRVMQSIMEFSPTETDSMSLDRIGMQNNHVYVGSTKSREVWVSSVDDFEDFTFTTPLRVPGEGFKVTLDSSLTAIVPSEDDTYLSGGDDDWYRVSLVLSSDQGGETITVKKLKTAPGQAAISQSAVGHIKNSIAFLSKEKVIDTLGSVENIETKQNTSLSDDIRDDLENYDVTGAHIKYYRRSFFVALPVEGLVLEYDLRFGYWQPPQTFPVAKLAIIDDRLCGHSSTSNETYVLYEGYNDLGAPFRANATFGYENYGSRFMLKNFDEAAVEGYIAENTVLSHRVNLEYQGALAVLEYEIDGSDSTILFTPAASAGLGQDPLGEEPLGSSGEELTSIAKFRVIHTTNYKDFFERQVVFESESPDCQFEIIAYGENARLSDNEASFIRK